MNTQDSPQPPGGPAPVKMPGHPALPLVLLYCVAGSCWILITDRLLVTYVPGGVWLSQLIAVTVTSVLFYGLLRHQYRHLEREADRCRRYADELRESYEKFHQLADNLTDVFWIRSPDGREVQYVSPAYERIWGRPVASLYAQPQQWADFILPEDRERVLSAFTLLAAGGASDVDIEYRIVRPDGGIRWVQVRAFQVRNAAGTPVRHAGIVTDITGRKQAEDELRWKTAFLEALVDSSPDGILVVDGQGEKILQNQRSKDLWKIPPAIAEAKDDASQVQFAATQVKHPAEFLRKVAHLYAHPEEVSREEIALSHGTILDRYSSPVRGRTGKYYGRIWTFRDNTERRRLEEQLRQAQKMETISHLSGGVIHDVNNILAVIQMLASLLVDDKNLTREQLDSVREIDQAAQRAGSLTRQLLVFSRQQALQLRDLDLNGAVHQITGLLQYALGRDVQMEFKPASFPLLTHADGGMIDQILMNLAVNSRDAMPAGGRFSIETAAVEFDAGTAAAIAHARPGSFACVRVSDTGCGIPPELLPKIFDRFFTTKEAGKGTGLGLAIVFDIVQQHQGWINVSSVTGRGTTFQFYLPRLIRAPDQVDGVRNECEHR